jgi:hypothetical protein
MVAVAEGLGTSVMMTDGHYGCLVPDLVDGAMVRMMLSDGFRLELEDHTEDREDGGLDVAVAA